MRTEVWKGTIISWFILRIFSETPVGDHLFCPFGGVLAEPLMQILGFIGSYRKISTGTITRISIREMSLVGSIP